MNKEHAQQAQTTDWLLKMENNRKWVGGGQVEWDSEQRFSRLYLKTWINSAWLCILILLKQLHFTVVSYK